MIRSLAYLVLLLTMFAAAEAAPAKTSPNIVFILIDDMGWKDIGANGSNYYKTPHIDQLAKEGMRFTNGYAACAVCSPSRAAIMTGQAPARLHITDWISGEEVPATSRFTLPDWTKELSPKLPTLPAILKKHGYTTATIGKWHLGKDAPAAYGFDVNVAGGHIGHPANYFWPYGKPAASHRVPMLADAGGQEGEFLSDRLTDEALKFIAQNKDKPFFLYLPHYAVHAPIQAKESDIALFKDAIADGKQSYPTYAGLVKSVDDSVGRIMAELKKLGLDDQTIVVFTSDNGGVVHFQATDCAPLRGGKGFPYEGGIRVPFIVKAPGITQAGSVSDTRVIGTDFLTTLTHLAGITDAQTQTADGVDLTPALKGGKLDRDTLVWHYPHYWNRGKLTPYSTIISGDWKLVRWYEYDSDELYDLAKDPSERHDLAAANPDVVKALSEKLSAILKQQGAQFGEARDSNAPALDPKSNWATQPSFIAQ